MLQEQIEIYKKMTPAERLQLAADFNSSARYFKEQCLRAQHPDWTAEQINSKVRELFLYATS
jgi:hypothetical protein